MTKLDLTKLQKAYVKVYGKSWRKYFTKYHWCVYDGGETGSTDVIKIKSRDRCASDLNRKI